MQFKYLNNYEEMSECASDIMISALKNKSDVNICLASGDSPALAYRLFVDKVKKDNVFVSDLYITKLDEWVGVECTSELSCEKFLKDLVIDPLELQEHFVSFKPDQEPEKEVQKVRKELAYRPIDLCILGLGKNGHLGLNEPSESLKANSHVVKIDKVTKTHAMIREKGSFIEKGMSIGIKDILDSRHILLLVSGDGKENIFRQLMKGEISCKLPASILWLHNNVTVLVRKDQFGDIE